MDASDRAPPRLLTFESMLKLSAISGCLACHPVDPESGPDAPLAPASRDVATRYRDQANAEERLLKSVRNGTLSQGKTWPEVNMRFMPASVALSQDNARDLVTWILSLEPMDQ